MKPKLLFLDDRTKRIHGALEMYSAEYTVTLASNVLEFLRLISKEDFDLWSLDNDPNGLDFVDPENSQTGSYIVRYIEKTGWPSTKPQPEVIIHSSNVLAATWMAKHLADLGFQVRRQPFLYPPEKKYGVGFIAGCFDVIHPGYIAMFKDAKRICEYLIVALHVDPCVERPEKLRPVLPVTERTEILLSLRFVDEVVTYLTEKDLLMLLMSIKPDVRILGSDYEGHPEAITGASFNVPFYYHDRTGHTWTSTMFKEMIAESVNGRKK